MLIAKSLHHNLSSALGPYVFVGVVGFLKYGHNVSQNSKLFREVLQTYHLVCCEVNEPWQHQKVTGGREWGREGSEGQVCFRKEQI